MITHFLQLVLKESVLFLKEYPDFFTLTAEKKKQLSEERFTHFPHMANLLCMETEEQFLSDLKATTSFLLSGKFETLNPLLTTLVEICAFDLSKILDTVSTLSEHSSFEKNIAQLLYIYSTQEITTCVQQFLEKTVGCPYIIVQTPVELSGDRKQEIRAELFKKYSYSFPSFAIQKNLIGGLRILVNGDTTDLSWYGKVMKLSKLLYPQT